MVKIIRHIKKLIIRIIKKINNKSLILGENVGLSINTVFGDYNNIGSNSYIISSKIGSYTYIASGCKLNKTKIGKFCAVGENVRTGIGIHPTNNIVSIHPAFFSLQKQCGMTFAETQLFDEHRFVDHESKYYVIIGNDVWIGNDVRIMDGVKIGDGAIVGLGAIVTKDVAPYSIVAGVPARVIGVRFSQNYVIDLLKINWWNWSYDKIKESVTDFMDIDAFISKYKK